jgi:hypothetical protein
VTDREKMEGSCSTGQSTQWAVVPVEEEDIIDFLLRAILMAATTAIIWGPRNFFVVRKGSSSTGEVWDPPALL